MGARLELAPSPRPRRPMTLLEAAASLGVAAESGERYEIKSGDDAKDLEL